MLNEGERQCRAYIGAMASFGSVDCFDSLMAIWKVCGI